MDGRGHKTFQFKADVRFLNFSSSYTDVFILGKYIDLYTYVFIFCKYIHFNKKNPLHGSYWMRINFYHMLTEVLIYKHKNAWLRNLK